MPTKAEWLRRARRNGWTDAEARRMFDLMIEAFPTLRFAWAPPVKPEVLR